MNNAFTINKLGLERAPFPFGITCCQNEGGLQSLRLYPQRVKDIFDLIEPFSQKQFAIFDVEQCSRSNIKTCECLSLQEIVQEDGISCQVYDPNFIVLKTNQVHNLLQGFGHYNLHGFDLPENSSEQQILETYFNFSDAIKNRLPFVLPELSGPQILIDSHDDCYLYIEAYALNLLKAILGRTVTMYSNTVLFENDVTSSSLPVPATLIDELWPINSSLTILRDQTKITENKLQVGISKRKFNFQEEQEYPVEIVIEYETVSQRWHLL
jgi:hypothetical protein